MQKKGIINDSPQDLKRRIGLQEVQRVREHIKSIERIEEEERFLQDLMNSHKTEDEETILQWHEDNIQPGNLLSAEHPGEEEFFMQERMDSWVASQVSLHARNDSSESEDIPEPEVVPHWHIKVIAA